MLIYKRFNRIEKILEPVVNSTSRYTIKKKLLLPPLADIEFLVDNHHIKDSFFISNERDVYTFSQAIQGNYDQIEGFLSSFKSPLMISDWLQEKGVNEHASLIVSDDNSFMLRKLVIMKEAGNKDFQELFSQYSIFLKSKNEKKESPYTAMYAKLIELTPYFIASNQEA